MTAGIVACAALTPDRGEGPKEIYRPPSPAPKFGIIGEALARLAKDDPEIAAQIPEHPRIIAFRNIIVHGYASVDDRIVWV